tara:strand:- start:92176 stop:92880 length:705 start_codon:yes stop_codon:yes gene_type:complete
MQSYIVALDDEKRRAAIFHSLNSLVTDQLAEPKIKNTNVELLRLAVFPVDKKYKNALDGVCRTTSYLARTITHHNEELVRHASLSKAQYLVSKWAERHSKKRGYSVETLRKNWTDYKIYAPLITAQIRSINRLKRKAHKNKEHDDLASQMRARLVSQITLAPTVLRQALHLQNLLSQHNSWGGSPPLDPLNELFFDTEALPLSPKPINWRRLNEDDLYLLKIEYKKDLELKKSK